MMIDPITFEVIHNALIYITEEMGIALRNSAYSHNIKERMDHSCAIFDASGNLIAQAEHIPVHLGSLPWAMGNLIDYFDENNLTWESGDIILVNDPYISGTHLNDLTLVKPVFHDGILIAYTANKAHHVDVGGETYGSISNDAKSIYDEGIVISPVKYFLNGTKSSQVEDEYVGAVKNPEIGRGDLRAQVAALNLGERRLHELAVSYSPRILFQVYENILRRGSEKMAKIFAGFPVGEFSAEDCLESVSSKSELTWIRVTLRKNDGILEVDFSDTDAEVDSSFNAVLGGTLSAAFFAIKSILDPDSDVNEGVLRQIRLIAPVGCLVNPLKPAAVSGGNLETSQRIADVVFRALAKALPGRVPAASTGSMNNIMAGGYDANAKKHWVYYETTGGGSGARPDEDGIDGVHCNMTNTMNTPIETIEQNYPMEFVEFGLRKNSGGKGKWRGGEGIVRSWRLTTDKAQVTVMADRHQQPPWGLKGGKPGKRGETILQRANGEVENLGSKKSFEMRRGDILTIKTPGGGGYGHSDSAP